MSSPVSVIIPTYNRRTRVREAVASVLAQRAASVELVVVDDGSQDQTTDALEQEFGDAIRVLRTSNRGVSAARNCGVAATSAEWIAFLDSDDLWLPQKLATQIAFFADNPGAQICQTEELWMRNGKRVNPRVRHRKPSGMIFAQSLELCLVSPSAVMLSRSLFERHGGFDEGLAACEDYDLWLRISSDTPIGLIEEPLVIRHAGHADQLSRRDWGLDRYRVAAIAGVLERQRLSEADRQAAKATMRKKTEILASGASRRGRFEEAQRYRQLADYYAGTQQS